MLTRKQIRIAEKEVARIWQQLAGERLTTAGGERIGVLYPGRVNGDSGPDFRDAVIMNEARFMQGDVEVHTESSDWFGHGHHLDAGYNQTVLHVALWHGPHSDTVLESGRSIPVLCLAEALRHQAYLMPRPLQCGGTVNRIGRQGVMTLLQAAGEKRFRQKVAHFEAEIRRTDPGTTEEAQARQVLFQGIMRALGYSKNTKPFEELARRVPLSYIESREGSLEKQALLLGTAGLLPSQRWRGAYAAEQEIRDLEQAWRSMERSSSSMKYDDWSFSHIYPNNSPVRRIVAMSYLLERHSKGAPAETSGGGLTAGLLRLVQAAPLSGGQNSLEQGLTVTGDGYWRDHFDFGVRSRTRISALLGNSKSREIAVNVVLPFAYARANMANEPELMKKALELYRSHPKLAENEITRHMTKQLSLEPASEVRAYHQQGLIHIFRHYCREGRCSRCPLTT